MMTRTAGLVMTRPFTKTHGQNLGRRLFGDSVTYISDFKGTQSLDLMTRFYRILNAPLPPRVADLEDAVPLQDVIRRDRILRHLRAIKAERIVFAMARAIDDILDEVDPRAVVGICLDNYVSDLLERLSARRGIEGVFPVDSPLPGVARITRRGEYRHVREPTDDEVAKTAEVLMKPTYKPPYMNFNREIGARLLMRAKEVGKAVLFPAMRAKNRDPLSFHYQWDPWNEELPNALFAPLFARKFCTEDWERRLDTTKRTTVFFPLQWAPETGLDYYIDDLRWLDYVPSVLSVLDVLTPNYTVVVKEHPAIYGYRRAKVYEAIRSFDNAVLAPPEVSARELSMRCDVTLGYAGSTTALEAKLMGRRVVCLAPSYFNEIAHVPVVGKRANLPALPGLIEAATNAVDVTDLVRRLLANTVNGRLNFVNMDERDPDELLQVDRVAEGLRRYLKLS